MIASVEQDVNIYLGENGTKQLQSSDGYAVLDYDYEKTYGLDFETIVYVNTDKVQFSDKNTFRTSISKVKVR